MSSDKENEYFSDGITVEIINALSKIEGLHVTARSSSFAFKNQNIDIREIGKKLNVAMVLEGSIRKSDNMVRITAQLSSAEKGFHTWSDSWDRELEDIFILQDEIASLIAEKVNSNIEPVAKTSPHTIENTDALDAYLRASYLLNTYDFHQASEIIRLFERAIELDPGLIKAYIGLSHAATWLGATGYLQPEEAEKKIVLCIGKALELDPDCPDIYILIASKNFWMEWDMALALENIEKALELRPSFPDALAYKGLFMAAAGYIEEAFDFMFQADRLDPYATNIKSGIGMLYGYINEDEKALQYIEANIRIAPYWDAQYMFKIESLCKLGRFEEAMETIDQIAQNPTSPLSIAELKAYYYACRKEKDKAEKWVETMKKEKSSPAKPGDPDSAFLSQIYLIMGNKDRALDYIEAAITERASPLLFNRVNYVWDTVRTHPRFLEAVKQIKYPKEIKADSDSRKKYAKSVMTDKEASDYILRLNSVMENQKPWKNPTLNLSDLAELIDTNVHTLSQILNEFIGKNFYDYVNTYRADYFLELNKQKKYKNYTLLSVAYECGFNSKTTFNNFFRKSFGKTPSEYYKMVQ